MGMGDKAGASGQTIGYRYFMSLHMGVARGPIDELMQINVGGVRAWPIPDGDSETISGRALIAHGPGGTGVILNEDGTSQTVSASQINTASAPGVVQINAPELFGGDKKEGGVKGSLTVMMGGPSQTVATWIRNLMGGRVPGFRGVTTLFFDGLVCSLNPYPKAWSMRVRRTVSGWDGDVWQPSLATVWMRNGTIKAMNGAHVIYECLTNRDWGRGFPRSFISESAFLAAAQTLFNENFGICQRWNRQDQLSGFIQQVIDHIGGAMYPDRTTGLIRLDLLRGDYDLEDIPLFTYDTGLVSIEEDETATQEDVVNEVIVNWEDPIRNEERQARVHNLASLQTLGGKNSTTTAYSGLPTVELALKVAQRDLEAVANSLNRYRVVLDRRGSKIYPGAVFRISAPEKNIFNAILRVGKIAHGSGTDGRITVDAVLDVFGLPAASFASAPDQEWNPPDRTAVVIDKSYLREATYADLVYRIPPAELALVSDTSGAIVTMAAKPTALSLGYNVASRTGSDDYVVRGGGSFVPFARCTGNVGRYQTVIPFDGGVDMGLVVVGTAVQIGNEICRLDDIESEDGITGTITVARGCVDTIPLTHADATSIFFFAMDVDGDAREYAQGEAVDVKLQTFTSTNTLALGLAPEDSIEISARQARPWLPGNLRVNGTPFGSVGAVAGDIALTWAHRDRKTIQDQLVPHGDGSVGPEAGVTYTVRVFDGPINTTPARTVTGLTGTGWTYTTAMRADDFVGATAVFEVEAVRGGIVSEFQYRFAVSS